MKKEDRIKRNPKVPFRIIEGEAILLTPSDSMVHTFNAVGTRVWELLEESTTVKIIVKSILEEFDVDPGELKKDVREFIRLLDERGMILINDQETESHTASDQT